MLRLRAESPRGRGGSPKGVIMVFGGTVSVLLMAMPMESLKCVPGYIRCFLFHKGLSAIETVKLMSTLSDKARRDGMPSPAAGR
jgi:flagellar motor component MotA